MKTVANLFATTHTALGVDHQQDRHFITIERFPPDDDHCCTFVKRVAGLAQNEYWIAREKNILMLLKKTPHVVRLRKEEEKNDSSYQTIKTRDAGISVAHWLRSRPVSAPGAPVRKHPFEEVGAFLMLAKYCLQALKGIHQMGVIHTNLRPDNICVPYKPYPYEFNGGVTLDYENLALIDFMFAISHTLRLSRPLPILDAPQPSSQSAQLLAALAEDRLNRNAERIQRLDYSVDLYALGFILEQIFQQNLHYPDQRQAELSMELHNLITELKSYEHGIPDAVKTRFFHLLPHDSYLKHIDYLLSLDQNISASANQSLEFDPAQFLEDDMAFSSHDELLEPESVTMTADQQKTPAPSAPSLHVTDDYGHIELNKGMIIVFIITAQAISFILHKGNELGLDVLASAGLLIVLGAMAAVACKLLAPTHSLALATAHHSDGVSTTTITGTPSHETNIMDHNNSSSVQDDSSDTIQLKKGVVISLIITGLLLFFIYREGHHLNLDILPSMALVLTLGVIAAFAGKILSPAPAPKLRPTLVDLDNLPPSSSVAEQTVSLAEIDAIAEQAGVTPTTASTSSPQMETMTATAADPAPEPASTATTGAESVNLTKAAAAALQESEAAAEQPHVVQLHSASAPVDAPEAQEPIELNKWAVIAAIIVFQAGLFGWHLFDLNKAAPQTAASPTDGAAAENTAAAEVAPETPVETAPTDMAAAPVDNSQASAAVDAAAAANIALLSETSSVSSPEVAAPKTKKEEVDSFLLSGSPSASATRPVKDKPVKKAVAKTMPAANTAVDSTDAAASAVAETAAADNTKDTTPTPVNTAPAITATTASASPAPVENKEKPVVKSLSRGLAEAQNTMGWHYYHGDGVKRDYEEAFKWFQKAANLGEPSAQFNIGMMYASGTGTKQDFAEAAKWYRKAADQGKTSAQLNLGMMYISGRGIRQNIDEGVKWLNKAADQGDATAKANLAWLIQQGYLKGAAPAPDTPAEAAKPE